MKPIPTRRLLIALPATLLALWLVFSDLAHLLPGHGPILRIHAAAPVPVAASRLDLDALAANRPADFFQVSSGTAVRILQRSAIRSEVEIRSGPAAGRTGWVAPEWIK